MKNQKGVTLIALVVTIVVLLILAGVAIAMLRGDNGILKEATTASKETDLGEQREAVLNVINEATTKYYDLKYVQNSATIKEVTQAQYIAKELITSSKSGALQNKVTITYADAGETAIGDVLTYTGKKIKIKLAADTSKTAIYDTETNPTGDLITSWN